MSAFIVSDNHINAIVSWAADPKNNYGRAMLTDECRDAGLMLMQENCKSVGFRYAHNAEVQKECADALVSYAFRFDKVTRSAVEIIKACECLDYQSCEHDGWESSAAKRFLDDVKSRAIGRLPGYDSAAWSI